MCVWSQAQLRVVDKQEDITSGQGIGRGSWHGGRAGRGPRVYTCFSCGKEGHFAANCPDKVTPKETPDVNLISSTVSINAVTRSQGQLLLKDVHEESKSKAKGKEAVKDELAEQRKLAARLTEEFAKLKPELPECSTTRQITKIAPKPFAEQKKASIPGSYKYVLKQDNAEMKGKAMMTDVPDKLAPEGKQKNKDEVQEPNGSKEEAKVQLEKPEKKVRFVEETATIPDVKQWVPVTVKPATKEVAQAGKSPAEVCVKEKQLKRSNTALRKDKESTSSKKVAKVKAEWRRVRVTESSESCCSSTESSSEEDQVTRPEALPNDGEVSVEKNINKQKLSGQGQRQEDKVDAKASGCFR